jgi:hypothetical protein
MFARALALLVLATGITTPVLAAPKAARPAAVKPASVPVTISEAWIREAPPGAQALGGYMAIANTSKQPLTLQGLSSPLFASIEMHNVVEENGQMRMKQAMSFTIPAGEVLVFKPRDRHFMLMGPKKELHAGDKVPLELDFGKAGKCAITVEVKRPTPRP